jgi:diguanylate cyclase (GGDEF)-like protein
MEFKVLTERPENKKQYWVSPYQTVSSLWHHKGPRQILRKLAEIIISRSEFDCVDFFKLERSKDQWSLSRKKILRHGGFSQLPLDAFSRLKGFLTSEDLEFGDLTEGLHHVNLGEAFYSLSLFRSCDDEMIIFIWSCSSLTRDKYEFLDFLIRAAQNEFNWLRKIHHSEKMLYIDDLTGLYNTRYFDLIITSELRRAERFKTEFTLLFIDLDGFKPINDQYGHLAGSHVLRQVAQLIRETVREVDIPIRFGGDEFIVILIGASCEMGVMVAERVRGRICDHPFQISETVTAHVTCSIGVASYPQHGQDKTTLTRIADESMYDSKKMGKNRVTVTSILGEKSCSN